MGITLEMLQIIEMTIHAEKCEPGFTFSVRILPLLQRNS